MKKSLLALAALGAFAGAAQAQSSVTLWGVVDLNGTYINNNDSTYSLGQDGMASSRLGFRGVEDLGGGLKASFWLEGSLGPDTGTGSSSFGNSSAANAFLFQRRSTLSLSNQWGELRLGRDYTPQFWNWTWFDPFGTNGVGAASNLGLAGANFLGSGAAYGTLVRANNSIGYILPNGQYGPGLYGQFMIAAGENDFGNKMWGGRIGYKAGPFDVAAAYSETDLTPSLSGTNWNIGGSWDFGALGKVSGFFGQIEVDVPGSDPRQTNWYIGYVVPFGQANFKASYGQVSGGGSVPNDARDASQIAIGADYNLSKRTALYATVSWIDNESRSNFRVGTQGRPLTELNAGSSSTGVQVGVRHSF
jgi:predicted porin